MIYPEISQPIRIGAKPKFSNANGGMLSRLSLIPITSRRAEMAAGLAPS